MQSILPPLQSNSEVSTQYKLFLESIYLIHKSRGRGTSNLSRVERLCAGFAGVQYSTILSNFGSQLII